MSSGHFESAHRSPHALSVRRVSAVKVAQLTFPNLCVDRQKRPRDVLAKVLLLLLRQEPKQIAGLGVVVVASAGVVASRASFHPPSRIAMAQALLITFRVFDGGVVGRRTTVVQRHRAIALLVVERAARPVHRELLVVGAHAV